MYVYRPHMTLNRDGEGLSISSSVGSSSEPLVGWEDAYLYSILKLLDYHLQHFGFVSYGCLHLSLNIEKSQHLSWKTERVWQSIVRKCVRCSAFSLLITKAHTWLDSAFEVTGQNYVVFCSFMWVISNDFFLVYRPIHWVLEK